MSPQIREISLGNTDVMFVVKQVTDFYVAVIEVQVLVQKLPSFVVSEVPDHALRSEFYEVLGVGGGSAVCPGYRVAALWGWRAVLDVLDFLPEGVVFRFEAHLGEIGVRKHQILVVLNKASGYSQIG